MVHFKELQAQQYLGQQNPNKGEREEQQSFYHWKKENQKVVGWGHDNLLTARWKHHLKDITPLGTNAGHYVSRTAEIRSLEL